MARCSKSFHKDSFSSILSLEKRREEKIARSVVRFHDSRSCCFALRPFFSGLAWMKILNHSTPLRKMIEPCVPLTRQESVTHSIGSNELDHTSNIRRKRRGTSNTGKGRESVLPLKSWGFCLLRFQLIRVLREKGSLRSRESEGRGTRKRSLLYYISVMATSPTQQPTQWIGIILK